jgi:hypothetical protein
VSVNVPVPWPLTAASTTRLGDTVSVPWATGAEDEGAADDGEDAEDEEEAGEVDPDDDRDPEVAVPDVPGAGCEP